MNPPEEEEGGDFPPISPTIQMFEPNYLQKNPKRDNAQLKHYRETIDILSHASESIEHYHDQDEKIQSKPEESISSISKDLDSNAKGSISKDVKTVEAKVPSAQGAIAAESAVAEGKDLEAEAKKAADAKKLEEEAKKAADAKKLEEEAKKAADAKKLEEEAKKLAESKEVESAETAVAEVNELKTTETEVEVTEEAQTSERNLAENEEAEQKNMKRKGRAMYLGIKKDGFSLFGCCIGR